MPANPNNNPPPESIFSFLKGYVSSWVEDSRAKAQHERRQRAEAERTVLWTCIPPRERLYIASSLLDLHEDDADVDLAEFNQSMNTYTGANNVLKRTMGHLFPWKT